MRLLYTILLNVALPVLFLRLWIKGRRVTGYRQHWGERLGYCGSTGGKVIWLHAVSVGEVRAAGLLIEALKRRYPEKQLVVTTTTPTGRQVLEQDYADRVDRIGYLPFDTPGAVRRFLDAVQPDMAVILEVELWPNLFAAIGARRVPLFLVNARLSDRSYRGYRKLPGLVRPMLENVTCVAVQTVEDEARFIALGMPADRLSVVGNLKLDAVLPGNFSISVDRSRSQLGAARPAWVAGSTHDGEESVVLEAHQRLREVVQGALLLLVPRHPERADAVAALCDGYGLSCVRYCESGYRVGDADVLLVDRLGQLIYCYGLAGVAFVGGSLVARGGHNPVEPLLAGAALVSGAGVANFQSVYSRLQAAGAVQYVAGADELEAAVRELIRDAAKQRHRVEAGRRVIDQERGAVGRILDLLNPGIRRDDGQ